MKAQYVLIRETNTHILIEDLDQLGCRSVTNDADAVIADLDTKLEGGIGPRKVIYLDSDKRWDELRHNKGKFVGFVSCSPNQQTFFDLMKTDIQ